MVKKTNPKSKKALLTPTKEARQSMGIGVIGEPNIVFARKFRWTMEGQHLPSHFFKSVKLDHKNKKIEFEYYEIANQEEGFHALVWADELDKRQLPDESLVFKTYDGCGHCLYEIEFFVLNLLSNLTDFDYSTSEESVRQISVSYAYSQSKLVSCKRAIGETIWKMDILVNYDNKIENIPLNFVERPSLTVEETSIHHLNSKMFTPGKAKWNPVQIRFKKTDDMDFVNNILSSKPKLFGVHLHQYKGDELLETWELSDCWFQSVRFSGDEMDVKLIHNQIRYKNKGTK
jgi:hypothetical protein